MFPIRKTHKIPLFVRTLIRIEPSVAHRIFFLAEALVRHSAGIAQRPKINKNKHLLKSQRKTRKKDGNTKTTQTPPNQPTTTKTYCPFFPPSTSEISGTFMSRCSLTGETEHCGSEEKPGITALGAATSTHFHIFASRPSTFS